MTTCKTCGSGAQVWADDDGIPTCHRYGCEEITPLKDELPTAQTKKWERRSRSSTFFGFRVIAYNPETKSDELMEIINAASYLDALKVAAHRYNHLKRLIPIK